MKRGLFSTKPIFYVIAFLSVGLLAWRPIHVSAVAASMSLTPSSQTVTQGSTVSVTIHEDSSTDTVNAIQVYLTYPSDKLAYSSISYASSAFNVHASESGGGGIVKLSVGKTPPPVSGDQIVATVNFQAVGSGTADVAFGCNLSSGSCSDGNAVVRSTDSTDILSSTVGASVTTNESNIDTLTSSQTLNAGQSIVSRNVIYLLIMQGDGNLVLYGGGRPLWSSGTGGSGANRAVMQSDGNLVLYRANNTAPWASNTFGNSGASMLMQDDGNLVIYSSGNVPKWSTNTGGRPSPTYFETDRLITNQSLPINNYLRSQDGKHAVLLQGDGNLVSYGAGYQVRWASGTGGLSVNRVVMQGDGNLVLYTASNQPVWASKSYGGASYVTVQNDGNFVVYSNSNGSSYWNPGSGGGRL